MKIIDILNKIANNEQPPKRIVFRNEVYDYDEQDGDYRNKNYDAIFDYHEITDILNDEVEILETTITYKPDKIEKLGFINNTSDASDLVALRNMQWENNQKFYRKINEIIEAINER